MIKTLITAIRLRWLAATTKFLQFQVIASDLFGVVQGIIVFFIPLTTSWVIQDLTNGRIEKALVWFYWLVALFVAYILQRFVWRYFFEVLDSVLPLHLKDIYYKKIFMQSYTWHLHNSVGYFATALDRVAKNISEFSRNMAHKYINNVVMTLCFLIYSFLVSYKLGIYFTATVFIFLFTARILYHKRQWHIECCARTGIAYEKSFIDFLYGIRSVKKMNLLSFVENNLDSKGKALKARAVALEHYNAVQWLFVETFVNLQFVLAMGYYIYAFIKTGQGLDVIVMLAGIRGRIVEFATEIMRFMLDMSRVSTEYKILAEHIGDDMPAPASQNNRGKSYPWRQIKFEKTVFEFIKEGNLFMHQVDDFVINKGDHIAVTGKSGEGKSTFLNLLTRQYMPQKGIILLDHTDFADVPSVFFNEHVTYISQDVELFNMSFYDNIVLGHKIKPKLLQKIIDGCCLNELIERMKGNMHAEIGEKGVKISGGEKQRINLARGLLLGRDILVLDEITANLDPETTKHIWNFIFKEYKNKTIIAVSHEKELLKHVGQIFDFKKGYGVVK
ncbi:MAG: ABC transporter ATP-binding protein/permease [Lactobacillales bacterium]|jgi:ABC-type bacteriocin/lantibiotic exporter with double-glycine peptidase domain|nr:ABC transporter ATP-binding protein/permease [Lactobacillales bacterium]